MRLCSIAGLTTVAIIALSIAPTPSAAKVDPPADDALRAKVRELEDRLARIEKQLAIPAPETIPFGDVVVNLKEERLQRYLRLKIVLQVDEATHKEMAAMVVKKRAELKSAALVYLADQGLADVSGSKGQEKVREVLKKEFGEILSPGAKKNPIKGVLFEEYVVQ